MITYDIAPSFWKQQVGDLKLSFSLKKGPCSEFLWHYFSWVTYLRITKEEKVTAAWSKERRLFSFQSLGGKGMGYLMLIIDAPLAVSVQQQTQGEKPVYSSAV